MKLPELKKKFNNKFVVRVIAGVLTIAMVGTGFNAYTVLAEKNDTKESQSTETTVDSEEESLTDMLNDSISVSQKEIGKEETVYLISDASGNVNSTIVSAHLINSNKSDTLKDRSTLTDIENVKGDETFDQSGKDLTWQANGADIFYQGTTNEKAPITQKVTYYLDGSEIAPEKLAGQSGKVTIRFDYTNNTSYKETVNGEEVSVVVPFAAITGIMLDDSFSNIQVTNGRLMNSGTGNIVIGYALPGVMDSLQVSEDDFDQDVEIPEYFEMTADVENFELETAMTVAVNAGSLVSTDGSSDLSDVDTMLDTLTDASVQLQDGSAQLADGLDTLQGNLPDLTSGVDQLVKGITDYTNGAATIDQGLNTLNNGVDTLAGSIPSLTEGITMLNSSAKTICDGIGALDKGLNTKMTEAEKSQVYAAARETVEKSFLEGTADAVAGQIYNALRYNPDGTDGTLYTSLYNGTAAGQFKDNFDTAYKEVARQVLLTACGKPATDTTTAADLSAAIKNKFKTGYDKYISAEYQQAVADGSVSIEVQASVTSGFVSYLATEKMNAEQLAEYLYAQGHDETLIVLTEQTIDANLSNASGQIQSGVESSLKYLASQLAGASKEVAVQAAQQAAVSGAESAKSNIASQIEAKQSNGYSLVTGAQALAAGTQNLANNAPALTDGVSALSGGVDQLVAGADTLVGNNKALTSGAAALSDGTSILSDGVAKLDEGSHTLADGMVEFNEQGINKIVNAYNGDLKPLASRLQAMIDAGEDYTSFTGVADGVNGNVKFIYKLDSIKAADKE